MPPCTRCASGYARSAYQTLHPVDWQREGKDFLKECGAEDAEKVKQSRRYRELRIDLVLRR